MSTNMFQRGEQPAQNQGKMFQQNTFSTPAPRFNHQIIPVRTVFSTDQISPQEIPMDGTPALFPLSDGNSILAIRLLPNGNFDRQVYTLCGSEAQNQPQSPTEFDQVMMRLNEIEMQLGRVLGDLYGNEKKEVVVDAGTNT